MMTTGSSGAIRDFILHHYAMTFRPAPNPATECASIWGGRMQGCGAFADVSERRMRGALRAATFYYVRMLDIENGVEDGLIGRQADYMFAVDYPSRVSPIYDGYSIDGFVIYDALRDGHPPPPHPTPPDDSDVACLISDGDQVDARDLEKDEVHLRKTARPRGRPLGSA